MPSCETKFTFTYCVVNVNFVQLNCACDQGRMVETCYAKENKTKYWERGFLVCLKRGQGKEIQNNDIYIVQEYSFPRLKWAKTEGRCSRPFVGQNWFRLVFLNRINTADVVGFFFYQPGTFPLPHIYTPHPPSAPSRAFPAGRLLVKMYSDQCPRTIWAQRMLWGACFCLSHSLITVFTSLQCPMQLFVQSGQIGFLMGAIQISFEFGMSFEHCQLGV